LVKWLETILAIGVDLSIVMEATGVYHEALAWFLYENEYAVCIGNPEV